MTVIQQVSIRFSELGGKKFEMGDEIVFTHGLVDIHSHGRDNNQLLGDGMTDILSHSVRQFGTVLLMPNLADKDALMTPEMAIAYHDRATKATGGEINILVTVYLNTDLTEDHIKMISEDSRIAGIKSYPAHGTTNSEHGLRTPLEAHKQLEWMQKYKVPLLVHGQVRTDDDGDVMDEWDREPYFYEEVAPELDRLYPELPISYEHLSTGVGAQAVIDRTGPTQGTYTSFHLGYTRTDAMDIGVRTDMVGKPMAQHAREKPKLWDALSAHPHLFALGSDDAWHPMRADHPIASKHAQNCACGWVHGPYRVGSYLDLFEKHNALHLFGQFASVNAARFYGFQVPDKTIRLRKMNYRVVDQLQFGNYSAQPLNAGEDRVGWCLVD